MEPAPVEVGESYLKQWLNSDEHKYAHFSNEIRAKVWQVSVFVKFPYFVGTSSWKVCEQ
jgi:hypothetical protein